MISIIIVNYNTYQYTINCIQSIYDKCIDTNFEIILVDNASNECSPIEFKKVFPEILLIESIKNLGFAGGNNLGIQKATGDYILLLNSDTELINNAPKICLDFLKSKNNIGLITCQLLYQDGVIQHNTRKFRTITWELLEIFPLFKFLSKKKSEELMLHTYFDHKRQVKADWVWGAFMLFHASILKEFPNQKLNEDFWMYCEDVLWSWEFKKLGHDAYFIPEAKVMHICGGSSNKVKGFNVKKVSIDNHAQFMKKYYPDWKWYVFAAIYFSKQYGFNFFNKLIKR